MIHHCRRETPPLIHRTDGLIQGQATVSTSLDKDWCSNKTKPLLFKHFLGFVPLVSRRIPRWFLFRRWLYSNMVMVSILLVLLWVVNLKGYIGLCCCFFLGGGGVAHFGCFSWNTMTGDLYPTKQPKPLRPFAACQMEPTAQPAAKPRPRSSSAWAPLATCHARTRPEARGKRCPDFSPEIAPGQTRDFHGDMTLGEMETMALKMQMDMEHGFLS